MSTLESLGPIVATLRSRGRHVAETKGDELIDSRLQLGSVKMEVRWIEMKTAMGSS